MHSQEARLVLDALFAQAHQLEVLKQANLRQHVWIIMLEAVRPNVTGSQTGGVALGSRRSAATTAKALAASDRGRKRKPGSKYAKKPQL